MSTVILGRAHRQLLSPWVPGPRFLGPTVYVQSLLRTMPSVEGRKQQRVTIIPRGRSPRDSQGFYLSVER